MPGLQDVARDLAKRHYFANRLKIQFGVGKIFDGLRGILPDRLPRIKHRFSSDHRNFIVSVEMEPGELRTLQPAFRSIRTISAVQPVWWLAPHPRPVSP